jgi:hypothetical protein
MSDLLVLLLTNAAVIGVAQAIGVFWLKTRLEKSIEHEYARKLVEYSAEVALGQEIAKQRVEILAKAWSKAALYESHLFQSVTTTAHAFLTELRRLGQPIPDTLPGSSRDSMVMLAEYGTVEFPADAHDRLAKQLAEHHASLQTEGSALEQFITENRFWLGPTLETALRRHLTTMVQSFGKLDPTPASRREFVAALRQLAEDRPTVETILKDIRPRLK